MLFVSEIIPIKYHRRQVIICDTESDLVGEMIYGDSVTDDVIRRRAPLIYRKPATNKKWGNRNGER